MIAYPAFVNETSAREPIRRVRAVHGARQLFTATAWISTSAPIGMSDDTPMRALVG